jgi:hypothetical protein
MSDRQRRYRSHHIVDAVVTKSTQLVPKTAMLWVRNRVHMSPHISDIGTYIGVIDMYQNRLLLGDQQRRCRSHHIVDDVVTKSKQLVPKSAMLWVRNRVHMSTHINDIATYIGVIYMYQNRLLLGDQQRRCRSHHIVDDAVTNPLHLVPRTDMRRVRYRVHM